MKKIIYSIFLLFLASSSLYSQWIMRSPYPGTNPITNIYAVSSSNLIASVNDIDLGEMMISSDGGITWSIQNFGPSNGFIKMDFVNSQTGYVICYYYPDKPMKTTNGGINWFALTGAIDSMKNGLDFVDTNTGWIVGPDGFISKSTNGGIIWFSQSNPSITTKKLFSVAAISPSVVFAVGQTQTIIKSTNGGSTFSLVPPIFTPATITLENIQFISSTTGFISGGQKIALTTNGGSTWDSVYGNAGSSSAIRFFDFNPSQTTGLFTSIDGKSIRTTNMGQTWTSLNSPASNFQAFCVKFIDENTVIMSGGGGSIYKSTNSGTSWFQISTRVYTGSLSGVSFVNNYTGFICGTSGFVAKTTNSGINFTGQFTGISQDLNVIEMVNENTGYIAGGGGNISKTTDGGGTWAPQTTFVSGSVEKMDFVNTNIGFASVNGVSILRTVNGGQDWTNRTPLPAGNYIRALDFTDSLTGYASGGCNIYKTTNSALSWVPYFTDSTASFYFIKFINSVTGFAGSANGNTASTYKTTNAGINWINVGSTDYPIIKAMDFANASTGIAVGLQGYEFTTTDGGVNWLPSVRKTIRTFNAVNYSKDGSRAWAVGDGGMVLEYDNTITGILTPYEIIPNGFVLHQNYPNPFNPTTSIKFDIPFTSFVKLKIYDILGKEVASIVNEEMHSGVYERTFEASKLSSGIYYYQLSSNDFLETKKMLLIK